MARQDVKITGISPTFRLRLAYSRWSNRLFCWLATHAPRLATAWALYRPIRTTLIMGVVTAVIVGLGLAAVINRY